MKFSSYNFFFPYEADKHIAYNAITNSLALIDSEQLTLLKDINETSTLNFDSQFHNDLLRGGYIIDENIDELDLLRSQLFQARYDTRGLYLTIVPTNNCNFKCIYCYEENRIRNTKMSLEVQNSVVRFIEKTISVFNIKHINISWYGGEPLMAIDIISLLSNSIIEICDSNNIIYNASIVTNGYFLTPKVIELLVRNRIKRIQVTIDGGPDTHNSRRPNKNGGPTFDRIMNNLKNFNNTNILVRIRINVDKENFCDYKQVIESIKLSTNENSKIIPYIALVEKYDNTTYDEKSCLSLSEFANIKIEFDEYLSGSLNNNGFDIYTMRKTTFCGADTFFNYVIDADGFVYSCWIDLGDKSLSMGQIHEIKGNDVKNAIRLRYLSYDATTDKKCLLCKLLPICMGGCPRKKRTSLERCSESIYSLEQQLKQTATRIIKMRSYINTRNENGGGK